MMFMFLLKSSSQKINKNVILNDFESFHKKLTESYPKLSDNLITCRQNDMCFAYADAKIKPENVFSGKDSKNITVNMLLGEVSNRNVLACLSVDGGYCSSNDRFAQKTIRDFDNKKGDLFAHLDNSFLLVGLDAAENCIHIATDAFNSRSIYWAEEDDQVLVSTDLSFIKTMLGRELQISERGLSSWLSGYPNPAISLFTDIQVLPIGYRLELSAENKPKIVKFWDIQPENKLTFESQAEYSDAFFTVLNNSVTAACDSKQSVVASQMSGGLDSTSVTALAKGNLNTQGKKVVPLSHMYTQSKKSDESRLVKDMLDVLKVDQSIQMAVDEGQNRNFLALYPTDLESPGTILSPRYVNELDLVKQAGADVLLTGNGGDEMCWGHSAAYTQRLKQGDWRVVAEVFKACSAVGLPKGKTLTNLFVKPFIPEIVLKMLTVSKANTDEQSVPIWLTEKAKSLSVEETRIDNPFDKRKDPVGYNRYHSIKTTSTYNAVRSYGKVAQQFDIDVRHPFFNTKVAELSFAVPAKQLIQGAYPKWLLRQSMQSHLPESVCWNVQKTTFDQHFGGLVRENAAELRDVLSDTRLADMGLVNQQLLLAEFDRVVSHPDVPLQVDLLYAILTFSWLRRHFPVG